MNRHRGHHHGWDRNERPDDRRSDDRDRSLDEYLDMVAAVGHRTRYAILSRLVHGGEASPTELEQVLDVEDSTLHYHLNELLDVGLVEKRVESERGEDGLYSSYRATGFGEVILTEGVDDLIRGEWEFEGMDGGEE